MSLHVSVLTSFVLHSSIPLHGCIKLIYQFNNGQTFAGYFRLLLKNEK